MLQSIPSPDQLDDDKKYQISVFSFTTDTCEADVKHQSGAGISLSGGRCPAAGGGSSGAGGEFFPDFVLGFGVL